MNNIIQVLQVTSLEKEEGQELNMMRRIDTTLQKILHDRLQRKLMLTAHLHEKQEPEHQRLNIIQQTVKYYLYNYAFININVFTQNCISYKTSVFKVIRSVLHLPISCQI